MTDRTNPSFAPDALGFGFGFFHDTIDGLRSLEKKRPHRFSRNGINFAKGYLEGDFCVVAELAPIGVNRAVYKFVIFAIPYRAGDVGGALAAHGGKAGLNGSESADWNDNSMMPLSPDQVQVGQRFVPSGIRLMGSEDIYDPWVDTLATAGDGAFDFVWVSGNRKRDTFEIFSSDTREDGASVGCVIECRTEGVDRVVNNIGHVVGREFDDFDLVQIAAGFSVALYNSGAVVRFEELGHHGVELVRFSNCLT